MFSGEFEITMDEKGRVSVPTRYREGLGGDVVMWRGIDGQIMVYPKEIWQKVAEKLGEQETHQRVRQVKWVFFSGIDVEIDRQGRVVIPATLRRHAQLSSDLVMMGNNDHLEIWSLARWEELNNRLFGESGDIADQLANLGVRL